MGFGPWKMGSEKIELGKGIGIFFPKSLHQIDALLQNPPFCPEGLLEIQRACLIKN